MSDPVFDLETPSGGHELSDMPLVIDQVALARLYGEPLFKMPHDLYIPPDALQVFLEAFEGPLDLLLYLIRKQNFNILDIPMAGLTRQYLSYVDEIRVHNLELAAEYLLMAAMLIEIKSRMLLPPKKVAEGEEAEDPRAELVRRLLEYEQIKLASVHLNEVPQYGRDFLLHAPLWSVRVSGLYSFALNKICSTSLMKCRRVGYKCSETTHTERESGRDDKESEAMASRVKR